MHQDHLSALSTVFVVLAAPMHADVLVTIPTATGGSLFDDGPVDVLFEIYFQDVHIANNQFVPDPPTALMFNHVPDPLTIGTTLVLEPGHPLFDGAVAKATDGHEDQVTLTGFPTNGTHAGDRGLFGTWATREPWVFGPVSLNGIDLQGYHITRITYEITESVYSYSPAGGAGGTTTAGLEGLLTFEGVLACPADLNLDGTVNVLDLLAMLSAWGSNPGHAADLNGDDVVDVLDLLLMLTAWGSCS